jgi:hypothetical protein
VQWVRKSNERHKQKPGDSKVRRMQPNIFSSVNLKSSIYMHFLQPLFVGTFQWKQKLVFLCGNWPT